MKFTNTPFFGYFIDQGKIYSTYHELKEIFGKPYYGPGKEADPPLDRALGRSSCQWRLKFEDGTIAIISDDRQKETNLGYYNWFIRGDSARAAVLVNEVVQNHRKNKINSS